MLTKKTQESLEEPNCVVHYKTASGKLTRLGRVLSLSVEQTVDYRTWKQLSSTELLECGGKAVKSTEVLLYIIDCGQHMKQSSNSWPFHIYAK